MSVEVRIEKKLGEFRLDMDWKSDSRRIGILGASGCGKSMTLKCIAGIETPDAGEIVVDGRTVFSAEKRVNVKPQKRRIGYMFQNYALFPTMSVGKNIAAGLKGTRREKEARVREMTARFRLEELENRLPGELSGGQQQRVALARIMAYEPEVILLDEPYAALDGFLKENLQQEMEKMLEDYAGTVILVSHSRDEIYRFSEELLLMDEGRVLCGGRTKEVFVHPRTKEAARLTGCRNMAAAHRRDAHTLEVPDYGVTLEFTREIPEDVRYIGFHAREFVPVWGGAEKNCIPLRVKGMAEFPAERTYFLRGAKEGGEEICWLVQRQMWAALDERGLPDFLQMPEEKILLFR